MKFVLNRCHYPRLRSSNSGGHLFYSSRNGSNASASSSSGGSRYKRHLPPRPYSPAALVTTTQSNISAQNHVNVCSTSAPTSSTHFIPDNATPRVLPIPVTEMQPKKIPLGCTHNGDNLLNLSPITAEPTIESTQIALKRNLSPLVHLDNGTVICGNPNLQSKEMHTLHNQLSEKNKIFNVDITQENFRRLQIEDRSPHSSEMSPDSSEMSSSLQVDIIPPLSRVDEYGSFSSMGTVHVPQSNPSLSINSINPASNISAVRLGNGHYHRPKELDLVNGDKRKTRGYVFHTFGQKQDSNH